MSRVTPDNRIPDIVRAAITVFERKGYRLTQMDEIAERAQVSKATLYYYFNNKAHLFHYVLEHGSRDGGATLPPPEATSSLTEKDLLQLLKKRLREDSRLNGMRSCRSAAGKRVDVSEEIAAITAELWDLIAKNRVQITILDRSVLEFPELAEIFDRYARGRVLKQLGDYLARRIAQGLIRPVHSVPITARFILESIAWFGHKQPLGRRPYSKAEALPDLVSIFVQGLRAGTAKHDER
jgi:AcrR family transcriptional regulator